MLFDLGATAILHDPDSITRSEHTCYHGINGELASCVTYASSTGIIFNAVDLKAHHTMTIAADLDRSKVAKVKLEIFNPLSLKTPGLLILLGLFAWALHRFLLRLKFFTEDAVVETPTVSEDTDDAPASTLNTK